MLNDAGPVPESVTPAIPTSCEFVTLIARAPLLGEIEPLGGETMLALTTGGRLPMLGQVTVDLILM